MGQKARWFKAYSEASGKVRLHLAELGHANKATELTDYSVCTTWGVGRRSARFYGVMAIQPEISSEIERPTFLNATRASTASN